MALKQIEFCLQAEQFELMDYPNLLQGQTLNIQLETDSLAPDANADSWYAVQSERLTHRFVKCGPGRAAFAGQVEDADLIEVDGMQGATLIVNCGGLPLRVYCGPADDGRLPFGTWETRYISGISRINGVVEEDYSLPGKRVDVTVWSFRRLVLSPGDALFGQWHDSFDLPPAPYQYDRVLVTARVHRSREDLALD